jgi:hypothetical protein
MAQNARDSVHEAQSSEYGKSGMMQSLEWWNSRAQGSIIRDSLQVRGH